MKFTYEYSSTGYRILADGVCVGGAGTNGNASHTSDGRRRHWRNRIKDTQMFKEQAEQICKELREGRGPAYLRKNLDS
jgi:hypothetical protein